MAIKPGVTPDFFRVLDIGSPPITDYPVTMCGWINSATLPSSALHCICQFADNSVTNEYLRIDIWDNAGTVVAECVARNSTTNGFIAGTTVLSANTWYHITGVFRSATDRELYLNGSTEGTASSSVTIAGNGLDSIGIGYEVDSAPTGSIANGSSIAEVAMWNVSLSNSEITALAMGVRPSMVRTGALVGYWPLHNVDDLSDLSGSKNNLEKVSTPASGNHAPVGRYIRMPSYDQLRHISDSRPAAVLDRLTPL